MCSTSTEYIHIFVNIIESLLICWYRVNTYVTLQLQLILRILKYERNIPTCLCVVWQASYDNFTSLYIFVLSDYMFIDWILHLLTQNSDRLTKELNKRNITEKDNGYLDGNLVFDLQGCYYASTYVTKVFVNTHIWLVEPICVKWNITVCVISPAFNLWHR